MSGRGSWLGGRASGTARCGSGAALASLRRWGSGARMLGVVCAIAAALALTARVVVARPELVGSGAITVIAANSASMRPELSQQLDALVAAYRANGALVSRGRPMFLMHGQTRTLAVEHAPTGERPCTSVAVVSLRELAFDLRRASEPTPREPAFDLRRASEPTPREPESATQLQSSKAGFVVSERCSPTTALAPARVVFALTMTAPKGTLEFITVQHAPGLAKLDVLLPERAIGPLELASDSGVRFVPAPLTARLLRARQSARRDGALLVVDVATRASERGDGAVRLELTAGCHRLVVLADGLQTPGIALDLDAELNLPGARDALRVDRSSVPDARLDFCVGETGPVELRYVGAEGSAPVTILDAYWPLPPGLPPRWPRGERAAMAWAMFRRRAPTVVDAPVIEVLGGHGTTRIPVALEPGVCYLAAVGLERQGSSARLVVRVGARTHHDDATEEPRGAALTFCSDGELAARIDVDAHSATSPWRMALWRLGGGSS
ncbi:MAG: hypothetical protein EXR75_06895 [Myxococcales bacterium]|nr:hypothetical protein [Myxococcales bacterium]